MLVLTLFHPLNSILVLNYDLKCYYFILVLTIYQYLRMRVYRMSKPRDLGLKHWLFPGRCYVFFTPGRAWLKVFIAFGGAHPSLHFRVI